MREIVVISGKGGTGKTSMTAAFAHLAGNAILCDLDVDAPDLHLILGPEIEYREEFISGHEAVIDVRQCSECGLCASLCAFEAVTERNDTYHIDPLRCEGCKLCVAMCPSEAIDFVPRHCGTWFRSTTRFGAMIHAQLFPGQENSGRLVSLLKREAHALAKETGAELILSDGSPGIGCPVISSLSQAKLAVVVTEPTPSGVHDLERVTALCDHFRIPVAVLINKCDLNPEKVQEIKVLCHERGYRLVGELPHDVAVIEAMVLGKAVTELDTNFGRQVRSAWAAITEILNP